MNHKMETETKKYSHIIFDLDGTLVDTFPGLADSIRFAIKTVLPDVNVPVSKTVIGPPIREIFRQIFPKLGKDKIELLAIQFRNHYDNVGWKNLAVFPHAEAILAELSNQNRVSFLVTTKPLAATKAILTHLGWIRYFKTIITPDSRNPSFASKQEAVQELIRVNNLDIQKIIMIGDTPNDAQAAYTTGIKFIGVSYGYGAFDENFELPVHKISCLTEFLTLI